MYVEWMIHSAIPHLFSRWVVGITAQGLQPVTVTDQVTVQVPEPEPVWSLRQGQNKVHIFRGPSKEVQIFFFKRAASDSIQYWLNNGYEGL
jgi:hypothetical protein